MSLLIVQGKMRGKLSALNARIAAYQSRDLGQTPTA
jgi:hypothetical protein